MAHTEIVYCCEHTNGVETIHHDRERAWDYYLRRADAIRLWRYERPNGARVLIGGEMERPANAMPAYIPREQRECAQRARAMLNLILALGLLGAPFTAPPSRT